MIPKTVWPWLLAIAASPCTALAEPMTFERAQTEAAQTAPNIRVAAIQVEAARVASRAAGALPDPQLTFGVDNFPISGPPAGRLGADEMTMARIGLIQEIPSRARRRAEVEVAVAQIGSAAAGARIEERNARLGAALAWIDLYYAQRRAAAVDTILQSLQPFWRAAPAAVATGSLRPAEALAPVQTRTRLQDRRAEAVAAVARATAELSRWTSDPAPSTVGPAPPFDIAEDELRARLDRQPTLAAFDAAAVRAQSDLELARAGRQPDWSVELSYAHRDPMFGDMVSIGASVRLPIFATQRQDPLIQARALDASRVSVERENARRAMTAALDGDLADHRMHHDQWRRARDELLPAIQSQADLETASYGAGGASLGDVLAAFSALADAKLDVLEREAMVARDAIRISLTYDGDGS